MALFAGRRDAGRRLAAELDDYREGGDVLVLGLPRGGVPVAYEVARALQAPLRCRVVRSFASGQTATRCWKATTTSPVRAQRGCACRRRVHQMSAGGRCSRSSRSRGRPAASFIARRCSRLQ